MKGNSMADEYVQPKTVTSSTGKQLVARNTPEGYVVNDGTYDRILIGFQKAGFGDKDLGIKVSQDGFDVKTASDDELIMSSAFNMFKIVAKGTSTIPAFTAGTSQTNVSSVTIPHGQSFTPIVEVFAKGYIVNSSIVVQSSTYVPLPIFISGENAIQNYYFPDTGSPTYYPLGIVFAVDSSNIYISAGSNTSGTSRTQAAIPITYYILRETAT